MRRLYPFQASRPFFSSLLCLATIADRGFRRSGVSGVASCGLGVRRAERTWATAAADLSALSSLTAEELRDGDPIRIRPWILACPVGKSDEAHFHRRGHANGSHARL